MHIRANTYVDIHACKYIQISPASLGPGHWAMTGGRGQASDAPGARVRPGRFKFTPSREQPTGPERGSQAQVQFVQQVDKPEGRPVSQSRFIRATGPWGRALWGSWIECTQPDSATVPGGPGPADSSSLSRESASG